MRKGPVRGSVQGAVVDLIPAPLAGPLVIIQIGSFVGTIGELQGYVVDGYAAPDAEAAPRNGDIEILQFAEFLFDRGKPFV